MLKTVFLTKKFTGKEPCVILLGGFDGAHLGHRFLIEKAKEYSLPIGIMTIVGGKGKSVFTPRERSELFLELGADFILEFLFEGIRTFSPLEFSKLLTDHFNAQAFLCGNDFRFGYRALGTPETLKECTHVPVEVIDLVKVNGEKVSSATIKTLLSEGRIEEANALIGSDLFLLGEVEKDRGVGRTMGFPTANVRYSPLKYPVKKGVYETVAIVDGKSYRAITNYGARPTFQDDRVLTESFLDGFSGDLYGKTLRIYFKRFLREIKKFSSAEELKKQLTEDIERIRNHD